MILSVFSWAIFGGICGWIASLLVNDISREQAKQFVFIGLAGAIFGGYIGMRIIPGVGPGDFGGSSMTAVSAAVILLWIRIYFQKAADKSNSIKIPHESVLEGEKDDHSHQDSERNQPKKGING